MSDALNNMIAMAVKKIVTPDQMEKFTKCVEDVQICADLIRKMDARQTHIENLLNQVLEELRECPKTELVEHNQALRLIAPKR